MAHNKKYSIAAAVMISFYSTATNKDFSYKMRPLNLWNKKETKIKPTIN